MSIREATKMKHVQVGGKDVYVFDDLFDFSFREYAYSYVKNSMYSIGNEDADAVESSQHKYMVSMWSKDDFNGLGLLQAIEGTPAGDLLKGKELLRAHVNLSTPTDVHWAHDHKNRIGMLYYANKHWSHHWAGETMFFNDDLSEVEYASVYKAGRLIIFDGEIPHSVRPQSAVAPNYRFTVSSFFKKE
jgi:Rps23 Pro-64 3,4-dihydroxylase Tpa1-like proline 4-hydroxylase